ncbi:MAG: hypothetical protein Q4D23_11635, partial [Bacteroidales bacterium]|nr:hypothetical protein [Bacteroidales bacterium]
TNLQTLNLTNTMKNTMQRYGVLGNVASFLCIFDKKSTIVRFVVYNTLQKRHYGVILQSHEVAKSGDKAWGGGHN